VIYIVSRFAIAKHILGWVCLVVAMPAVAHSMHKVDSLNVISVAMEKKGVITSMALAMLEG
jgi:hypothetical protein